MFRIGPINPPPLNVVALPTGHTGQCWPQQSPIVLSKATSIQATFPADYFKIEYPAGATYLGYFEVKDGQKNFVLCKNAGDLPKIRLGNETARLIKIHYHDGSEHDIEGVQRRGEIHLLHEIEHPREGSVHIALGIHFEPDSETDTCLKECPLPAAPAAKDGTVEPDPQDRPSIYWINPSRLLPPPDTQKPTASKPDTSKHWYRYEGSLTTPPFSETVRWLVFVKPIRVCNSDLDAIRCGATQHEEPTQPLHRRFVLRNFA